jgi:hypothetical protein
MAAIRDRDAQEAGRGLLLRLPIRSRLIEKHQPSVRSASNDGQRTIREKRQQFVVIDQPHFAFSRAG